ncbi:hydroxyethylthiazole kinase [Virgibacillus oceani]|uniref:Hydroxyethylthiazole kinase n=1 Tax=Virgibacillus oceani TaxID=1479511 RepID=A0A917M323_9BACI|nr:hydroxyethylthiazole kinase [Virgibacillus oceani]GGG74634.1 hydroxyethylthiazole kinase [Virgibacillus oceani]
MNYLAKIREQKPLIHNITNIVVANFSANGLLALGASPAMANAPEEAAEMASHADALVLNIGTCTEDQVKAMLIAGMAANEKGIPVILDPVAIGATKFRTDAVMQILTELDITVIRGNIGEIAFLGETDARMKGADALMDKVEPEIAVYAAKKYNSIVTATGKTDIITDGSNYTLCNNGSSMLPNITGTGCLLTAVVGAFCSVTEDYYEASIQAVSSYGVAAQLASEKSNGPGSFLSIFMDELYRLTEAAVQQSAKLHEYNCKGVGSNDR